MNRDFGERRRPFYGFANTVPGVVHPNAEAHRIIATELAAYFAARVLPGE